MSGYVFTVKHEGQFKPGHAGHKKKGAVNKVTQDARVVFKTIMEGQVPLIEKALQDVYDTSPVNYLSCLAKLMPYFMPKMLDLTSGGDKLTPVIIDWSSNEGNPDAKAKGSA